MARIRLARIAFIKPKTIFGTRRVSLESKKIAYVSLILSLLLYGSESECWGTKLAIQIPDADRKRTMLIRDKCIKSFAASSW